MAKDEIELVLDAHAQIGESPIWSVPEQALYWIDVKAPALYRLNPATGGTRTWPLPDEIGCYALYVGEPVALLGLRSGLFRLDLVSDALSKLADPPYNPLRYRFNEGGCDGTGRFWTGTMFDPKEEAGNPEPGPLYSYQAATGLVTQPDRAMITNGLCWSKDGRTMFLSHSKEHTIYQYDFDPEQGRISNRRLFAQIPSHLGMPDGAALDEEGCYWSAIHGGGRLIRFKPDGQVDREVKLPVSQPTMCAFAGPDLDVLYVTSAASGLSIVHKVTEPHAGGLFRFRPGVRGLPTHGFKG
ncbi:MAG TPA: SMP-30/gluconolactonase/LRE family protein [Acetobacteraceae bacterium]|jgi:sugar lactone lactonase YvrE|nr:SMP-30/gluconolactonase/LRE family protein [Acetobacteraceae bacterium]